MICADRMTPAGRPARSARLWSLWIILLSLGCEAPPTQVAELSGQTMGTTYSVKLAPAPPADTLNRLQQQIDARLDAINRTMSTYRRDSDLMRFNLADTTDWQPVPAALARLVTHANTISTLSDGMYDITVGPLVNLWGFGNSGTRDTPPSRTEIDAIMDRVGYRKLESRLDPPALRKATAGLQIDLSSIAKGWGVDQIGELLEARGIKNYLVEIGGELLARGDKTPGKPWRIAVERPSDRLHDVQRVLPLQDAAMATSGDYRNFFDNGGQRFSHTIDPNTGESVRHRLASVSVIADNCAIADAWATALMALGDQRGPAVARTQGIKALFIIRGDNGLHEQVSPALAGSAAWQQFD